MTGIGAPPTQNSLNNLSSSISTINSNISTLESNFNDLYLNKANKYYDYKVITVIPDNADLNNYLTIGSYSIPSNASAKTIANLPVDGSSGTLYVINCLGSADNMTKTGYEYFIQIFLGYTAYLYMRSIQCNNGTMSYSSWVSLT